MAQGRVFRWPELALLEALVALVLRPKQRLQLLKLLKRRRRLAAFGDLVPEPERFGSSRFGGRGGVVRWRVFRGPSRKKTRIAHKWTIAKEDPDPSLWGTPTPTYLPEHSHLIGWQLRLCVCVCVCVCVCQIVCVGWDTGWGEGEGL